MLCPPYINVNKGCTARKQSKQYITITDISTIETNINVYLSMYKQFNHIRIPL